MALVLLKLKVALVRAGLTAAGMKGVVGFVLALVIAVACGAFAGVLFALVRLAGPAGATDAALGGFALLFLIWALGPVLTAASDGTLPPERLAPFPLSARQLMPGLLLAGVCGFGGLATVLALGGALAGLVPASPLAFVTVLAIAAQLALCVIGSRLVVTALSGAARTRRWRDVALIAGPVLALGINLVLQVVVRGSFDTSRPGRADPELFDSVRGVLRVLPSGPPALAAAYARDGQTFEAIVSLAGSGVLIIGGLALWHVVLRRTLTSASGSSPERASRVRSLYPWFARFLPRNRLGAVAAKELRLTWRDPRQRAALFGSLMGPVIMIVSFRTLTSSDPRIVLFAAAPLYFIGVSSVNLFGFDGRAAWMNVGAPGDAGHDVFGKVAAKAIIAALVTTPAAVVLVWRAGSVAYTPDLVVLAVAAFGVGMGGAAVLSVRSPMPLPDTPANVFSTGNAGQGFSAAFPALALMLGTATVLTPVVLGVVFVESLLGRAAVAVGALTLGITVLSVGLRSAASYLRSHWSELLSDLYATP